MVADRPRHVGPAVRELRRARRDRRLGDRSRADAAYQVYVTVLAGGAVTLLATGLVGDDPVAVEDAERLLLEGPAWVGLVVAVLLAGAVRVGLRGGPLGLERADVHHLLLAPVDRSRVLARPAARLLGAALVSGAVVGAIAGDLIGHRLPGHRVGWVLGAAAHGAAVGVLVLAVALLAAGRSVPAAALRAGVGVVTTWAAADVAGIVPAAPTTALGRLVVFAERPHLPALLAPLVALAVAAVAVTRIGGLSMEAARRRTALVGQLRFAVTQHDVRTVLLLRRQLSAEGRRGRPWIPVPGGRLADRLPVVARDLHSVARWPLGRAARLGGLGAVAGAAAAGAWSGTTPLLLVSGGALFLAALDAVEPLAQELDHPTRLRSLPLPAGRVLADHLAVPAAVLVLAVGVATAVAAALEPDRTFLAVLAMGAVPAALAAVAGAAVSVVSEPVLDTATEALVPAEVAGPRLVLRAAWPVAIAAFGWYPLFVAAQLQAEGLEPLADARTALVPVVVLVGLTVAWVRYRADVHRRLGAGGHAP